MYQLPDYIIFSQINSPNINYSWDDSDVESCLNYDYANYIINKVNAISLRAKIALSIGIYEWILGRFEGLYHNVIPKQIAEMAWCANINKEYTYYLEFDRAEYLGPINAPIWCGFSFLIPTLYVSENVGIDESNASDIFGYDENAWETALLYLISITIHIVPKNKLSIFIDWLEGVVHRLLNFYIMPEEDPFINLFGHKNDKDWLGDYISREVLDLNYAYFPDKSVELCDKYLQSVDYISNPFLLLPEDIANNKIKTPYRLLQE